MCGYRSKAPENDELGIPQPGVVELLVEAGANVDETDDWGFTPLHWAAGRGHSGICQLLLDAGADIEADSHYGSPLSYAAVRGQARAAEVLLAAGADPDEALGWAASKGHNELVTMLLDAGADVRSSEEHGGRTPSDLAAENNQWDTVALLDEYMAVQAAPLLLDDQ